MIMQHPKLKWHALVKPKVEFLPEAFPGAKAHSGFLEQLASITTTDKAASRTLADHIDVKMRLLPTAVQLARITPFRVTSLPCCRSSQEVSSPTASCAPDTAWALLCQSWVCYLLVGPAHACMADTWHGYRIQQGFCVHAQRECGQRWNTLMLMCAATTLRARASATRPSARPSTFWWGARCAQ